MTLAEKLKVKPEHTRKVDPYGIWQYALGEAGRVPMDTQAVGQDTLYMLAYTLGKACMRLRPDGNGVSWDIPKAVSLLERALPTLNQHYERRQRGK